MKLNRLLVSSCLAAAVLGTPALAGLVSAKSAPDAKSAIDNKQKPPDKPKPKAPDKPKPPPAKPPAKETPKETPAKKTVAVGSEVDGALTLTDTDAKAHKLSEMRGKVVVLQFWSAHSADSSAYDKRLAEIATAQGAKGVVFFGIDSDKSDFDATVKDPKATLHDALKTRGLDGKMTLVLDKDGALMTQLNGKPAPYALVIDAKGILRYAGPIDDDPKGDKKDAKHFLNDAIEAAAAAKPAPPPEGKEPPKKG